ASVALIGEEPIASYERPPLSKATLAARPGEHKVRLLFGDVAELAASGVTPLIPETAVGVNLIARTVELASGVPIGYGHLLFATGATPRKLPASGGALKGIHYLRTFEQAVALSYELQHAQKVVVIGGGFIGLEVSAT